MKKSVALKLVVILCCAGLLAVMCATGVECLFRQFFGVICPGCGMSRALIACSRLDFAAAFRYHPMVFSLPVLFLLFWKDGRIFKNNILNWVVIGAVGCGFLANYVVELIRIY